MLSSVGIPSSNVYATDITRDRDHCRALLPNLVVAHWFGETTLAAVHGLDTLVRRASARYPEGICLIQVVSSGAAMPSAESRAELAALLRRGSALIGSAVVVPGVGFRVAAARAVVTGLAMLVRPAFPHVVHATIADAVAGFAPLLRAKGVNLTANAVERAIESLASAS